MSKIVDQAVHKRVSKVRSWFILNDPFYASLTMRLRLVQAPGIQTAATDGVRLWYEPSFIASLTDDELRGLLAHEVMHCVFLHHTRRGKRNPTVWNIAGDHLINLLLRQQNFILPNGALMDDRFSGMTVEQVYTILMDEFEKQGGAPGEGTYQDPCGGVQDFSGDDGQGGDDAEEQDGASQGGAGQDDGDDQWKPGKQKSASQAEKAQQAHDWKIAVVQAAKVAKMEGKLPGGMDRYVEDLVTTQVDWRSVLQDWVSATSKTDYTWSRPNRRTISGGLYLPSMDSQDALGTLVLVMDTSGSISQRDINVFASELSAILEAYDVEVHVIYVDTEVANHQEFTSDDLPITLEPKGYGGTDFVPGFDWVQDQGIRPTGLIYFTDLECSSYPPYTPEYPVLWVTSGYNRGNPWASTPSFGEVINVDADK